MTNKTITLSRDAAERMVSCAESYVDIDDADLIELRAALAGPVPPAGGDVEVLAFPEFRDLEAHPVADIEYQRDVGYNQALADARPIVTRLQVEVERLKDRLADANAIANLAATNLEEFKEDHRSELTKARELLHRAHAADTAGRHELPYNVSRLMDDIEAFLQANQSAPVDKSQGEPVAWLNVATGEFTTCPLVVMDWADEKEQVQSLYAEQPAPVAVVMPERKEFGRSKSLDIEATGWNACLDEVARLNPIK